jgi:hypothetical protein
VRDPGRDTPHRYTLTAAREAGYRALERLEADMALRPSAWERRTERDAPAASSERAASTPPDRPDP